MSDIPLLTIPEFVDDGDMLSRGRARAWPCYKLAHACNWLNFYARKVVPYARFGSPVVPSAKFVFPVDAAPTGTRYLTVIVGFRAYTASAVAGANIKSSTNATGVDIDMFSTSGSGSPPTVTAQGSEEPVIYGAAHIAITANRREQITITPDSGVTIDGCGAWELPAGMYAALGCPTLQQGVAVVSSALSPAVDPTKFIPGHFINTDLGAIQTGLEAAFDLNRPILFCQPAASTGLDLHTASPANNGAYVTVPTGGIYIPPGAVRSGATQRAIRVAVYVDNGAAGTTSWRVQTSKGNYDGALVDDVAAQWSPMGDPYDATVNGVLAQVATAGEWITIGLREDAGANSDPHIHGIVIWDAGDDT